jgi:hypothetical protein
MDVVWRVEGATKDPDALHLQGQTHSRRGRKSEYRRASGESAASWRW